jgi:DNA-binding transcriptional ArsR family regulator
MTVVELFKALGEPTRLEMVERLSTKKFYTLTTLSHGLKLTRQGARKHLKVLEEANLIVLKNIGRDTVVELDEKTLDLGKKFITKLEKQWESRLEKLKDFVESKK